MKDELKQALKIVIIINSDEIQKIIAAEAIERALDKPMMQGLEVVADYMKSDGFGGFEVHVFVEKKS